MKVLVVVLFGGGVMNEYGLSYDIYDFFLTNAPNTGAKNATMALV